MARPKILYHFADGRNAKSIDTAGLVAVPDYILAPDARAGVNLVETPDSDTPPPIRDEVIYRVDTSDLVESKFELVGNDWWRYHDHIPASNLRKETRLACDI